MNYLNSFAIFLAIALGLVLAAVALFSLRNPIIGKLGIRNIPRRPTQSLLIILGLTLGTLIIVAALSLGDTLNNTVQRQAIDAYGQIDQVVAPSFLGDLTALVDGGTIDPDNAESPESAALLNALTRGDLASIVALFENGLPGITEARYTQLQDETADDPLIDGMASSILFPTIVRNVNSGQGEPLGFIFAVDETYNAEFGLHDTDGVPVHMADLQPGIGNVFVGAADLWGNAWTVTGQVGSTLGLEDIGVTEAIQAIVAAGALLTAEEGPAITPRQLQLDVATLRDLGFDTDFLDQQGIEVLSLESLGISDEQLAQLGIDPDTPISLPTLSTLGVDLPDPTTATNNLLSALNLNILGQNIDNTLNQYGLQLRQGEIYLNRLGAQQLNARPGDLLDIFIGPIPVPYRVRAIVEESGPLGAVLPVVMLHTDEAQKLLFMSGRINNILISNAGDEISGMVHTAVVNEQLRVLSLNQERLAEVLHILHKPEVVAVIQREAPNAGLIEIEGPPEFIANFFTMLSQSADFEAHIAVLIAAISGENGVEVGPELRAALSNARIQSWLQELPLPAADAQALNLVLADLNDFDVLNPLSKQFVVQAADVAGIAFGSIFSSFGILSIFAGVLLIFLIFVMMAAERRSELGIARAVGMQRGHLVQMFVTEGMLYDLVAALVGLGLGLLVSYGMLGFLNGLFANLSQQVGSQSLPFQFRWSVTTTSLIISYCLGVILTFAVVTIASWNVSRLNIVAAILNLPDTAKESRRGRIRQTLRGLAILLLVISAGYLIWLGREYGQTVTFIGGTLLLLGSGWSIGSWLPMRPDLRQRSSYTLIGAGLILIWAMPWTRVVGAENVFFNQNPAFTLLSFALSGPLIIIGAILLVMFNADSIAGGFTRLVGGIGSLTPVLKIAIAYPLHNRFRTGVAMLLFAMVITAVTVMSVVIRATEVVTEPSEERTVGFDIVLSPGLLSFFAPVTDIAAEAAIRPDFPREQVSVLGSVSRLRIDASAGDQGWSSMASDIGLTGIDEGYTKQAQQYYGFQMRAPGFDSDEAVWQALAERDDVAVIMPWMVAGPEERPDTDVTFSGPGVEVSAFSLQLYGFSVEEGATIPQLEIKLRSQPTDDTEPLQHTVQIIGILEDGEALAGGSIQVNRRVLDILNGEAVSPERFYVKVAPGAEERATAQALERAMLSSGFNAVLLSDQFAAGQAVLRGILGLFQGFLALGLVVGIAGLGVISNRTVVERRQQIGILRSIGYQNGTVATLFVLEANFIALTGILVGGITGLILADKTIGQAYDMATQQNFPTPWLTIAGMLLFAWLFSLLATILPAWQASRIYPAEALRYE